jgi:hypothetical protein
VFFKEIINFYFKLIKNNFNILISKINFKKIKKYIILIYF